MRGLESTEVVEETDFTIHDLLRRTKRPCARCSMTAQPRCGRTTA